MRIEVSGIANISKMLENVDIEENSDKVVEKVANKILEEAKSRTPVRTGNLRKGWKLKSVNKNEYIIYNTVNYAKFVEYGHKVRGKSNKMILGKFMLRDAVNDVIPEMVGMIRNGLFRR